MFPSSLRSAFAKSRNYKYWAFGAIAIGTFGSVMDHGSVEVALPTIASRFDTDIPTIQWVVLGFALTITALLLPMGRLADIVGPKRVYILGSLVFVLGAGLAGSSSTLIMLILSRILQGVGAAMTQGTGMAIIISAFPPGERGKAIGLIMTVVGAGFVAGPAIGGLLVDAFDWPFVFFINVPLGLVGVTVAIVVLEKISSAREARDQQSKFDWLGAVLSTGALVALLMAMTNGHRTGWASPPILVAAVTFAALLSAFIWWELRIANPMLDLRLFARRTFSLGILAAFLTFLGSSAVLFLIPFYVQGVLGFSPKIAGLITIPGALCMAVMGPLSGALSDRYGWRWFTVGGLAGSVTGLILLSRLTETSSLALVIPALVLINSGMGLFYSPNSSSVLSSVDPEKYGIVSSFLNLIRNGANIVSLAMATAIVTATMGALGFEPSLDAVRESTEVGVGQAFSLGLRYALLVMAGLVLIALAVSAFRSERFKELEPATPS